MSGTTPITEARKRPRRSWPARIARASLWSALGLVLLLVVAWVFRQQLVVPWLRPRLEAALAEALGAEKVSIGELGGNWLSRLDAAGIEVQRARPPLRELRGARVEARYSLAALVRGDLSGLRSARVSAAFAELDLRPDAAAASDPAGPTEPLDLTAYEPLLRLCPLGASLRVADLRVVAANGERRAPLELDLAAATDDRGLSAAFSGVHVVARVRARKAGGPAPRVDASLDAADPGALLDLFGVGAGVRGGRLHAEAGAELEPPSVELRVDLRDLAHGEERLSESHVEARIDRDRLAVAQATLDLPGVSVEVKELALPSPLGPGGVSLRGLAGSFAVRIDDLAPHAGLLPAEVLALLPVHGRIAGSVAGGTLRLDPSELHARGVDLTVEQGAFALADEDWRQAAGSLRFALALDGFAPGLPVAAGASLTGRVSGTVAGSMAAPALDVRLDLGECRHAQAAFAGASGLVRADPASVTVEGLRVRGLRVPALGTDATTDLALDARCGLAGGAIDPDSAVARLDVESFVPGELLAPVLAAQGLRAAPEGPVKLVLEARQTAAGIEVARLRAHTTRASPLDLAVEGDGTLPLHWSPAAGLTAVGSGTLALEVTATVPAARIGDAPVSFAGALRIGSHSVELRRLELGAGEIAVRGEATAERGVAALVSAGSLEDCPLRVELDLAELDLARLPPSWTAGWRTGGRVTGRIRVAGTPRALEPDVALTLAGGSLSGEGWPSLVDARMRLEASSRDPATGAISVAVSLAAELDQAYGLDRGVSLEAKLRCDETGTVLEPTVLVVGGGRLDIEMRSSLRQSDVLGGTVDPASTSLSGRIALREFVIGRLPATLIAKLLPGVGQVRGTATGEVVLDGTLASLPSAVHGAKLSLKDGEIKSGELPRLERLAAEITCDRNEIALRSLTGVLGAGRVSARGSLRHDGKPLWDAFEDAKLDLKIDGEDVLLYRGEGAKGRATLHVTASGTPRRCLIGGEVAFGRGSKYVRRISLVPDLSARGGESASDGFHLFELPHEIGDRIRLDLTVKTSQPFEVRTALFDCECDALAHLRGTGSSPRLEGTISMRDGILRFPGANLRVTSGLVTFTRSEPLFPDLLVHAEGKRVGIQVSMMISGRYDKPLVQLTSIPPLPPQDLIVLLSTGQLPSTITERGTMAQARFVGGFLAKELLDDLLGSESTERGGSIFDRFTLETGREVSKNGIESVLAEFEMTKNLTVQAERDVYEDYNMGIVLRFKFR